jgi:hypothetical protein
MRAINRFIYDWVLACTFIRTEELSSIIGVTFYTKPSSKNLKTGIEISRKYFG